MLKLLVFVSGMALLSGCCEVFGICTSVSIHSSNVSPNGITPDQWTFGPAKAPGTLSRNCVSSTSS